MTDQVPGEVVAPAFIDQAREYRAKGGHRPELVDYLRRCGVDPAGAEQLADRFDLELGLAGAAQPHDISPAVAQQLDAHWAQVAAAATVPVPVHEAPVPAAPVAPYGSTDQAPSAPESLVTSIADIEAEVQAAVATAPSAVASHTHVPARAAASTAEVVGFAAVETAATHAAVAAPVAPAPATRAAAATQAAPATAPVAHTAPAPATHHEPATAPIAHTAPAPATHHEPATAPIAHTAPAPATVAVAHTPAAPAATAPTHPTPAQAQPAAEPVAPPAQPEPAHHQPAAPAAEGHTLTVEPAVAARTAEASPVAADTIPVPAPGTEPDAAPIAFMPAPTRSEDPALSLEDYLGGTEPAPMPASPVTEPDPTPAAPPADVQVSAAPKQADSADSTTAAPKQAYMRPPRSEKASAAPDTSDWGETTDFGYKIAQSWEDDDPNAAINSANELARAGKSFEEIVEFLVSSQVSPDEADYVASMTGARKEITPERAQAIAEARRRKGRGRRIALAIAMIAAGGVLMWVGWNAYQTGADTGSRSPLGLVAAGGALVLNALRTLIRR